MIDSDLIQDLQGFFVFGINNINNSKDLKPYKWFQKKTTKNFNALAKKKYNELTIYQKLHRLISKEDKLKIDKVFVMLGAMNFFENVLENNVVKKTASSASSASSSISNNHNILYTDAAQKGEFSLLQLPDEVVVLLPDKLRERLYKLVYQESPQVKKRSSIYSIIESYAQPDETYTKTNSRTNSISKSNSKKILLSQRN